MKRHKELSRSGRTKIGKRRIAVLLVGFAALVAWSAGGSQIISALNPALRHELQLAMHPALDVWITPPTPAGASPIIISTPAGMLYDHATITVPEGSTVSAHLAEQAGSAPELIVDDKTTDFTTDAHGDFAATGKLTEGSNLSIRRNGRVLAAWKIDVVADTPPKISLTEPLSITSSKALRVAYTASDNFGVNEVAVVVTPRNPLPGADDRPVTIALPVEMAKEIARVDFADLTARPWAGQAVSVQLEAVNQAGQKTLSDPVTITLPERTFFHPVARVLIEERKRLLLHPDDEALREEAANIMAGIAHETADYHGDPVILMSLRAGAVRLILDRGHETALSINDLLWQAATRIEDGNGGQAQQMLRDARQDLADAVMRHAGDEEVQQLTERLQRAMQDYVARLSVHRTDSELTTGQAQAHLPGIQ